MLIKPSVEGMLLFPASRIVKEAWWGALGPCKFPVVYCAADFRIKYHPSPHAYLNSWDQPFHSFLELGGKAYGSQLIQVSAVCPRRVCTTWNANKSVVHMSVLVKIRAISIFLSCTKVSGSLLGIVCFPCACIFIWKWQERMHQFCRLGTLYCCEVCQVQLGVGLQCSDMWDCGCLGMFECCIQEINTPPDQCPLFRMHVTF